MATRMPNGEIHHTEDEIALMREHIKKIYRGGPVRMRDAARAGVLHTHIAAHERRKREHK